MSTYFTTESISSPEIAQDFSPIFRVYKDGRIERLVGNDIVPASLDDPKTNVLSKDVVFSPEANLCSRLYLPKGTSPDQKLPVLIYYHGGGFCTESAYSPTYHNYLNTLVEEANVVAVSVEYRRAPEHPLPIAFDDCWTALKWVASHSNGDGPEPWLNCHADLDKVFFSGDSAGATISHRIAMKFGQERLAGINVVGIALVHPYFWGTEPVGNENILPWARSRTAAMWKFACPTSSGSDDPFINPAADPKLAGLGCTKVLVIVAERDMFRERGRYYYEILGKSGWGGKLELMESKDEDHVFHLSNLTSDNSVALRKKIIAFIHED